MATLQKLLKLLTVTELKKLFILLVMIVIMALLDMIGIASIMPFIAVLTNPSIIESNQILSIGYKFFAFSDVHYFVLLLGISVFFTLVISLAFKALTSYYQVRFIQMCEYSISQRLLATYLSQSYGWFLNRNSSSLANSILSEVSTVMTGVMTPMLIITSQSAIVFALLVMLLFVDPILVLFIGAILGVAYYAVFKIIGSTLISRGRERKNANLQKHFIVNEVFAAIKQVKLGSLEGIFHSRFAHQAKNYATHTAFGATLSMLPRYLLEATSFGGMILVVLYLIAGESSLASVIPLVSLYAFTGYRLMPAVQQIYSGSSQLHFVGPTLDALYHDMNSLKRMPSNEITEVEIEFSRNITLKNVSYKYPGANKFAITNASLNIPINSIIGVVGQTGGGKTTLIDLIMGLLEPSDGSLIVDGALINLENRRSWQGNIGFVPQEIFLSDATVAENIAFGVRFQDIDYGAVEHASKIANLHSFVINEMPEGYKSLVGERGVRLSGGQRQRIGIARALYRKPKVLIFDEATSALDGVTEKAVMDAVNNLSGSVTIILIAHRLSTVRNCDSIYMVESGAISCFGGYQELLLSNENFRMMAIANAQK